MVLICLVLTAAKSVAVKGLRAIRWGIVQALKQMVTFAVARVWTH